MEKVKRWNKRLPAVVREQVIKRPIFKELYDALNLLEIGQSFTIPKRYIPTDLVVYRYCRGLKIRVSMETKGDEVVIHRTK